MHITHIDGHLVNVDPLLDAEFWNQNIEGSIENTNDLCLPDNRSVPLSQISNQDTKEQMI